MCPAPGLFRLQALAELFFLPQPSAGLDMDSLWASVAVYATEVNGVRVGSRAYVLRHFGATKHHSGDPKRDFMGSKGAGASFP